MMLLRDYLQQPAHAREASKLLVDPAQVVQAVANFIRGAKIVVEKFRDYDAFHLHYHLARDSPILPLDEMEHGDHRGSRCLGTLGLGRPSNSWISDQLPRTNH